MQIISPSQILFMLVPLFSIRKLCCESRPDLTLVLWPFQIVIMQRFFKRQLAETENFPLSCLSDSMQCC